MLDLHLYHDNQIVITYDVTQTPNHELIHTELEIGTYEQKLENDLIKDSLVLTQSDIETLRGIITEHHMVTTQIEHFSKWLFRGANEENYTYKIQKYESEVTKVLEQADKRVEFLRRDSDLLETVTKIVEYSEQRPKVTTFVFTSHRDLDEKIH